MIKLPSRPNPPGKLTSQSVAQSLSSIEQKVLKGDSLNSRTDFPNYWHPEARELLWINQKKRCCYCERLREAKRESDLEHFRPKSMVTEDTNHKGYWWLAYNWSNYFFSCKPCNSDYKANHFPVLDNSRAFGPDDRLTDEFPVLIDPCIEDPEEYIDYQWESNGPYVKAVGSIRDTENRGRETINILGLNRTELMEGRAANLSVLSGIAKLMNAYEMFPMLRTQKEFERVTQLIREQTDFNSDINYIGFRRAFFRRWDLGGYIVA